MAWRSDLPPHTSLPKQYDLYDFIQPSRFTGKLAGKVVLVTGASNGVGRATALAFAAAGAKICCVARRQAQLDELVAEITSKHPSSSALALSADLTDPTAPQTVVAATETSLGPIDILINNAGIVRLSRFADEPTFATWWRVIQLNQQAPAALIHAVLPSMLARRTGVLLHVASTGGAHDIPFVTAYATAKAATIKLHQNLAFELAGTGVVTFNVHPGNLWTGLAQQPEAVNAASVEKDERMAALVEGWRTGIKYQSVALAANTIVALCVEDRCRRWLNGRYVDAEQDVGEVLDAFESGRADRERLYHLKIDQV